MTSFELGSRILSVLFYFIEFLSYFCINCLFCVHFVFNCHLSLKVRFVFVPYHVVFRILNISCLIVLHS